MRDSQGKGAGANSVGGPWPHFELLMTTGPPNSTTLRVRRPYSKTNETLKPLLAEEERVENKKGMGRREAAGSLTQALWNVMTQSQGQWVIPDTCWLGSVTPPTPAMHSAGPCQNKVEQWDGDTRATSVPWSAGAGDVGKGWRRGGDKTNERDGKAVCLKTSTPTVWFRRLLIPGKKGRSHSLGELSSQAELDTTCRSGGKWFPRTQSLWQPAVPVRAKINVKEIDNTDHQLLIYTLHGSVSC